MEDDTLEIGVVELWRGWVTVPDVTLGKGKQFSYLGIDRNSKR